MRVYLDSDFRCHLTNDCTMKEYALYKKWRCGY